MFRVINFIVLLVTAITWIADWIFQSAVYFQN